MPRIPKKLRSLIAKHYDLVMLFTFSLIIFVSKTPIIGSTPKYTKNAMKLGPLFPKSSMVIDYSSGDFTLAMREQQKSDLLVVYFYAPWDSQSIKTSATFKRVSEIFTDGVKFIAINCWEPSGSCASQTYLTRFPTVALYARGLLPVVYDGPMRADYLAAFIYRAVHPYHVIYSSANITSLHSQYDNIIAGYFNFSIGLRPPGFFQFYAASMKLLSKSITSRYTTMAVVIGDKIANELNLTRSGKIAIFRLNNSTVHPSPKTLPYKCSEIWDLLWTPGYLQTPVVMWLQPSRSKSRMLDSALSIGPAAILILRHSPLASSTYEFSKLRELALVYRSCSAPFDHPLPLNSRTYRTFQRTAHRRWHNVCIQWRKFLHSFAFICLRHDSDDRSQCSSVAWMQASNRCTFCDPDQFGPELPRACASTCQRFKDSTAQPLDSLTRLLRCNPSQLRLIRSEAQQLWNVAEGLKMPVTNPKDEESQTRPSERQLDERCRLHELADEMTASKAKEEAPEGLDDQGIVAQVESQVGGLGCKTNRSLNFFALDDGLYPAFAERMGVNSSEGRQTLVVVDWKNEGVYSMRKSFRYVDVAKFVSNFHKHHLPTVFRSEEESSDTIQEPSILPDLTGRRMESLKSSNKENVVLYYQPSCGFCSMFMHKFRNLVHYFSNQNSIMFSRINVAENDLPWELRVEHLPTIILFPSAGSSRLPSVLKLNRHVTLSDLVSFVLRSSTSQVFLRAASHVCDHLCLSGNHERLVHHLRELNKYKMISSDLLKTAGKRLDQLNSKFDGMKMFKTAILDWSEWVIWWRDFKPIKQELRLLINFYNHRLSKFKEYELKIASASKVVERLNLFWKRPEALWKDLLSNTNHTNL